LVLAKLMLAGELTQGSTGGDLLLMLLLIFGLSLLLLVLLQLLVLVLLVLLLLVLLAYPRRVHAGPRHLGVCPGPSRRGGIGRRPHKVARAFLLAPALVHFHLTRRPHRLDGRECRHPRRDEMPLGSGLWWLHQQGSGHAARLL